jgi:DnaK suppressor protein
MKHLKTSRLESLKNSLLKEKKELEAHFDINRETDLEGRRLSPTDSDGELSSYDNHPADSGTVTFEKERDMALDEKLGKMLAQVNRALSRMEEGTYGLDAATGEPIPYERLKALPFTQHAVENAPEHDFEDYRPVEEEVMTLPPSGAGESRQAHAGRFDDADAWKMLEEYGNASDTVPAEPQDAEDANEMEKLR